MQVKLKLRIIIILASMVISVYYLFPTFRLQIMDAGAKEQLRLRGELRDIERRALKKGLDLQGGMHLVLEVNLYELFNNLARNKDPQFTGIMDKLRTVKVESDEDIYNAFLTLANDNKMPLNRYYNVPGRGNEKVIDFLKKQATDAVDKALQILRNRIDQFGVSEPSIQGVGSKRIIVELPGIQDIERARELIGRTALLEFKLLIDPETTTEALNRIDNYLKRRRLLAAGKDTSELAVQTTKKDTTKKKAASDSTVSLSELFQGVSDTSTGVSDLDSAVVDEKTFGENPFFSLFRDLRPYHREIGVPEKNVNAVKHILSMPEVERLIPPDAEFVWSNQPEFLENTNYYELYLLKKEPELTGSVITDAQVQIGSGYSTNAGQPEVHMAMNDEGARVWSRVTGANIGKKIAIVLDDKIYSAPVVRSKIPTGNSVIEGIGNMNEAKDLSIVLRAGALPAPVEIIEERTVGPSLGADSISSGVWSTLISMILVVLFMIIYYKASGLLASFALFVNMVIILAIMAGFHATLTLPGIAGFALSIGMAVDANVLILERIREELRTGKTVRAAIVSGYARAFSAILDSNVTTIITGMVLYQYGTGPIRGFALTLNIGLVANLFTAIVVTRVVYDLITSRWNLRTLSI